MEPVKIQKADEEQRMVYGEVYSPLKPDVHGEYMDAEAIRKMAYNFMRELKLASVDTQHENVLTPGVHVVESFIARDDDATFIPGSWVVGVHVDDDALWEKVKKGELNGFSVEALVIKQEQEVEIEIPDELTGPTSIVQGHSHVFTAKFGEDGKFLGGQTDYVDGHNHRIVTGTVTEVAKGHRHRFSSVDNLSITEG